MTNNYAASSSSQSPVLCVSHRKQSLLLKLLPPEGQESKDKLTELHEASSSHGNGSRLSSAKSGNFSHHHSVWFNFYSPSPCPSTSQHPVPF
jgi:hypothetical protein